MTVQLTFYGSPERLRVRVAPLPLAVPACQRRPRLDRPVDPHVDARVHPPVDAQVDPHVEPHVDRPGARPLRRTLDGVLGAALMVAVAFVGAAMAGSEALRLAASL